MLVTELGDQVEVVDPSKMNRAAVSDAVLSIHDRQYVTEVLEGHSGEWSGERPEMGETALTMFAGTQLLTERIIAAETRIGFNPQGAKHHAAFAHSSGFCVFNDMAWAATALADAGLRPIYIDWDIHAGDGVQHLLADTSIPTLSVHGHSTFPGDPETVNRELAREGKRHTAHDRDRAIFNWGINPTDGDDALEWALNEMDAVVADYRPGVILLAAGADGHGGVNNLGSTNTYTYAGFERAAHRVAGWASHYAESKVLIGGAGGYQPLNHTPRIWANVVSTIVHKLANK
jgi:acetoin utilization protein AcuC